MRSEECVSLFDKIESQARPDRSNMGESDEDLLRYYLIRDKDIKVKDECIIGVGYNSCIDVNFKASELLDLLEPLILNMEEEDGIPITPKVHDKIGNLREFIETFAYQFVNGANAERFAANKDIFDLFYITL